MLFQSDPFQSARDAAPVLIFKLEDERIPLLLRLQDVRKACKKTGSYSNDNPFHITLNPETGVRTVRQLPIETDPPDHTDYRAIVEPLFQRPNRPDYAEAMRKLVEAEVAGAVKRGGLDIVREFALPLQSRALTLLLGLPESEADLWISWGVHVFHDGDGSEKGKALEAHTAEQFARAEREPGDDFFSQLHQARFQGRPLTFEEKQGFANLVFAGGRDTVIAATSALFARVAEDPHLLDRISHEPELTSTAVEELVRLTSPLTAISRTCPHDTEHQRAGGRVGLCWASANRDERFFPEPDQFQADRNPNPHVGFGFGAHNCLGAAHARLLLRTVFTVLSEQKITVSLLGSTPKLETFGSVNRQAGFQELRLRIQKAGL